MELSFGIPDWPGGGQVSTEELVERLRRHFPAMRIDREKGLAFVQQQLDTLMAMRVPEVILRAHKGCRDDTIYVSISDPNWLGGTATAYVKAIRNPALEGVDFVVTGVADEATRIRITRELACALDMALCREINWETGGRLPEGVEGRAEPGDADGGGR